MHGDVARCEGVVALIVLTVLAASAALATFGMLLTIRRVAAILPYTILPYTILPLHYTPLRYTLLRYTSLHYTPQALGTGHTFHGYGTDHTCHAQTTLSMLRPHSPCSDHAFHAHGPSLIPHPLIGADASPPRGGGHLHE